jgi:AcrR family transcriptional regulator
MKNHESKYYNTALLMTEALLILLEKKEYEYITIKEICEKAGVNRSTFYLHYETIDDLLEETITMTNNKFKEAFNNKTINPKILQKEDFFFIKEELLIPYLIFVKENKQIYKLMFKYTNLFKGEVQLKRFYDEIFIIALEKYGVPKLERDYVFSYYINGLVAVIQKWIEKDCKDDISFITNLIIKLIVYKN